MTQTLLVTAGEITPDAPTTRTGGVPLAPAGFAWPACRTCSTPMQFQAHLPLDDATVAVFMCAHQPGLCEEWDPAAGGNAAHVFSGDLVAAAAPEGAPTALVPTSAQPEVVEEGGYAEARRGWSERSGRPTLDVLGNLGGDPEWIQSDEVVPCPDCGADAAPMGFVGHLEQRGEMNFGGGGVGYVFRCATHPRAAFLWQC